jgi:S-adenosylmethionine synthetase
MFGYACDHTDEFLPWPIYLAHRLSRHLAHLRKSGKIPCLLPDGKTQVTVAWDDEGIRIDNIVIAAHHAAETTRDELCEILKPEIIQALPKQFSKNEIPVHINSAGDFIKGGPAADTGLTGRKIIVDTYGGLARHGGGAFSGKDATKVDRSGHYMARHMAKSVVACGLAGECEIQFAYAIGKEDPVSVGVDTFGTALTADSDIEDLLKRHFDLSLSGIIEHLNLRKPVYRQVASYGHFGRNDLQLAWEKIRDLNQQRRQDYSIGNGNSTPMQFDDTSRRKRHTDN